MRTILKIHNGNNICNSTSFTLRMRLTQNKSNVGYTCVNIESLLIGTVQQICEQTPKTDKTLNYWKSGKSIWQKNNDNNIFSESNYLNDLKVTKR